jgi:hypothetical protein
MVAELVKGDLVVAVGAFDGGKDLGYATSLPRTSGTEELSHGGAKLGDRKVRPAQRQGGWRPSDHVTP